MSDNDRDNDRGLEDTPAERQPPHRIVGTPPPAPGILTDPERGDGDDGRKGTTPYGPGEAEAPELAELPAENPNPVSARNWERVAAVLFIVSALASVAFVAAYVGLEVDGDTKGNVVVATLRSNLALGSAMSLAFLAIGIGMVIWVRNIMPPVELAEERHPMASPEEDREAFAETIIEGAEASQITKRPLLRRTLIAATLPAAIAPLVLLRDLGPLPERQPADHGVEKGHAAARLRDEPADHARGLRLPGRHDHGGAGGLPGQRRGPGQSHRDHHQDGAGPASDTHPVQRRGRRGETRC